MKATAAALPCPKHGHPLGRCAWCLADRDYVFAIRAVLSPRPVDAETAAVARVARPARGAAAIPLPTDGAERGGR